MDKPRPQSRQQARKILIVDDHPMMRRGLATLIEGEPGLVVCGEANNVKTALAAIARIRPHLVIVDLSLEDSDGMDLLRAMRERYPRIPALVLSMHDESLFAERVLRAGARGYVAKHEMGETVLTAIGRLLAGERSMSPKMTTRFAEAFLGGSISKSDSSLATLSDRELQVFRLIGAGKTTGAIARALRVSVKTVESHRAHIKAKLKLESGAALARHATQWTATEGTAR